VTPQGRVVLITGGSSGIGRATALLSAAAGDHLVLVARGLESLYDVAAECDAAGAASTLVLAADVGDDAAMQACVAQALERHGHLDAAVHSAGVVAYGRTEEVPAAIFDGVIRTNLLGSVNLVRHVLPVLRRRRAGSIVLVGSVIGHIAVPMMSPYVLSKWGIRALARQLQIENRDRSDVHISYVSPGGVDTPIYVQAATYAGHVGRPPPPVLAPEAVARVVLRRLDHPRKRTQVGAANDLMRFGFSAFPAVFDALVGTLFPVGATDLTYDVPDREGNVLSSQPGGNRLRGNQGNPVVGVVRNLAVRLRVGSEDA
jgi:NAD(P)-dependent dehydrogenase (short-subunit alcohol dehydrogenase family)